MYSIEHFLDKNKDTMPGDASSLLRSSSNDLIGVLFRGNRDQVYDKLARDMYTYVHGYNISVPDPPSPSLGYQHRDTVSQLPQNHESISTLCENLREPLTVIRM